MIAKKRLPVTVSTTVPQEIVSLEVMHIDECPYADNVGVCKKCVLDWLQSEAE